MIFVGVAIVVGVLIFAGTCAHFVQKRSVLVAEAKRAINERRQCIHTQDREVIESFIDSVVNGVPIGDALPEFQKARAAVLPEHPASNGHWLIEDADAVLSAQLRGEVEAISRRLFLPMILTSLLVIAITVIAATAMYSFFEPSTQSNFSNPLPSPPAKPYDPFAVDPFANTGVQK